MPQTYYTINPLTGRRIKVGGDVFNQLTFTAYDFINEELIRRASAPPIPPRQYFLNTETGCTILACSRRYRELISAGWDIEDDYYLIPPYRFAKTMARINQEAERMRPPMLPTYENIMAEHGERLANLNISLCRECFSAIKLEEGECCNDCRA